MQIKDFLNKFRKRLAVIIVFPLALALATALACAYVIKPVYEANTRVYVFSSLEQQQSGISYNDLMVDQYFVRDYQELIKSRKVIETVIRETGLEETAVHGLAGRIRVESVKDTRVLQIIVRDTDPHRAVIIANAVTDAFTRQVDMLMNMRNIHLVDSAQTPDLPVSPKTLQYTALAFLLGCLSGFTVVLLLDYLDDTIKTSEDVEKYLGLKVLGNIPETAKTKKSEDAYYGIEE